MCRNLPKNIPVIIGGVMVYLLLGIKMNRKIHSKPYYLAIEFHFCRKIYNIVDPHRKTSL